MIELSNGAVVLAEDLHRGGTEERGYVLYRVDGVTGEGVSPDGLDNDVYQTAAVWCGDSGRPELFGEKTFVELRDAEVDYDNRRGAKPLPFHREETAGVSRD